jgi:ornithine carbamoyltransferase
MTIQERKTPVSKSLEEVTVAFIGDVNAQLHDLIKVASIMRMPLRISVPDLNTLQKEGDSSVISYHENPKEALKGADVIYSDFSKEISPESPFALTKALIANAKPDAIFMSRLAQDRDPTTNEDIISDKNSVIFEQALNRLYIHKALLVYLLAPHFFEK